MSDNTYFASKEAKETAAVVLGRATTWLSQMRANGYLEKLRKMWFAYHGAYYRDSGSGHEISFSGEQGELAQLPVNHLKNLADHMLIIITANRPAMEARATNTDYKSLTQTQLANGLLDYYMREKRLEKYLKRAVEYAIVLSAGYIKMEWDAMSGEVHDYVEETKTPVYEGDVKFSNLSPFDVFFDGAKESFDLDWILCRSYKNRFDLAAKYPEHADKIKNLPSKSDLDKAVRFTEFGFNETDDVPIYEFYHKETESMPNGRYILFADPDIILIDNPMPYRILPVFRITPGEILGTPYGYSPLFDLLPLQEALNSLYSTILTNQNAFGVQNVLVPRGADIDVNSLAGGLNIIEYNQGAGVPAPLNLTNTPAEIFKMLELLKQDMETLSGVNSVARGNPEASLKSGAALALVQSMALQFMSGLQQTYVQLVEDVGTALIVMLKDFAVAPRVAAIVGKSNRAYLQEFKGEDLSNISRVIVDFGNPLARTTAGRVEMAQQMLQMGVIKNPSQYFSVINTGKLEVMHEGEVAETLLIRGENEKMMAGTQVGAIAVDDHKMHILEHKAVLSDPDLRQNPELTSLVLNHIQEHINLLKNTDPDLLALLGQQSLQAPPPPPAQGDPGQVMQAPQDSAELAGPGGGEVGMPNIPKPPAPFENLPTNPQDTTSG